jgi:hypothetical protein
MMRATYRLVEQGASEDELRHAAIGAVRRRRNFRVHLVAQVFGTLLLVLIWATTEYQNAGGWPTGFRTGRNNHDWDPWIIYPVIASLVGLGVHAWVAFGRAPASESDIEREMERLR